MSTSSLGFLIRAMFGTHSCSPLSTSQLIKAKPKGKVCLRSLKLVAEFSDSDLGSLQLMLTQSRAEPQWGLGGEGVADLSVATFSPLHLKSCLSETAN